MAGSVQLGGAVIRNESEQVIRDVKIIHAPTGKMGEVNMVLPHSAFELGQLNSALKADQAQISWIDSRGRLRQAVVRLPAARGANQDMILVYRFDNGGGVTADLQPADK